MHDTDPVSKAEHLWQLARDQQHGDPLLGEVDEQPVDLGLRPDVDAACRLVHDQQTPGGRHSHLPRTTFCWLPPESERAGTSRPLRAVNWSRAPAFFRRGRLGPAADPSDSANSDVLEPDHRQVLADRTIDERGLRRGGPLSRRPFRPRSHVLESRDGSRGRRPRSSRTRGSHQRSRARPLSARHPSIPPARRSPHGGSRTKTPLIRRPSSRFDTRRTTSRPGSAARGMSPDSSRPTIRDSSSLRARSAVVLVATSLPSRRTTSRSLSSKISCMWWET